MTGSRWRVAILSTILAAAPLATGQESPAASQPSVSTPLDLPSQSEALEYQIEWRLIPAGYARLKWMAASPSGPQHKVWLHLESAGLVSRLFHVEDDYTVAMGQNLCAQNSLTTTHEGNRNRETRVTYDSQARKATYLEKDLNRNTTTSRDIDIPACVHDVIGGLMVLRTLRLDPGKTVQIPVSDGKKFVQVKIESERREEIRTAMGLRKTIRYEVFLFDNALYRRSGHLHVWLTDDNQRLPVQLEVRLQFAIGTITLKLEKEEKL